MQANKQEEYDVTNLVSQFEILKLAMGYFPSNILIALFKLKIFELISQGYTDINQLSEKAEIRTNSLVRLLRAGVAIGVLKEAAGNFTLSRSVKHTLLSEHSKNYLGNSLLNLGHFQEALTNLDKAVKENKPTINPKTHIGKDKDKTTDFIMSMNDYAGYRAVDLANHLEIKECKNLLDLGCGPGTYAYQLALKNTEIDLYLADFPEVISITKEVRKSFSITNKTNFLELNIIEDKIEGQYDLILLSNVLHMINKEQSRQIINTLYNNLNEGGSIVIQGQFLMDSKPKNLWPVFLDLILLCTSDSGENHTKNETIGWLEEAGFSNIQHHNMSYFNPCSYIRGYKR